MPIQDLKRWHFDVETFYYVNSSIIQFDLIQKIVELTLEFSGLYYKHTMILNYSSSIVNKLEALLTDDARVIIYDHHVFIVQATTYFPRASVTKEKKVL
jgi:hypothetical protein